MKPTSTFKLSKSVKRVIAAYADPQMQNTIKRMGIQAELAAAVQPRRERQKTQDSGQNDSI